MTEVPGLVDQLARAIYMTHWKPADPDSGRPGAPVWENASNNVREWVTAQAEAAIAAAGNAGYAIVPVEPTPEMLAPFDEEDVADRMLQRPSWATEIWATMLAAHAGERR